MRSTDTIQTSISVIERREVGLHSLPEDVPHGLLVRCGLRPPAGAAPVVVIAVVVAPSLAFVAAARSGADFVFKSRVCGKNRRRWHLVVGESQCGWRAIDFSGRGRRVVYVEASGGLPVLHSSGGSAGSDSQLARAQFRPKIILFRLKIARSTKRQADVKTSNKIDQESFR